MIHTDGYFQGVRKTDIFFQAWLPEGGGKAALLFLHGLGSHGGRYANIVDCLVPRGYAVYGFDQIGHGKSGGKRSMIGRFEDFTDTLALYHHNVKSREPGKPVFLFGHSMGGLIAAAYLLDHQAEFQGVVFSAPALAVSERISPAAILMVRILSILAPGIGVLRLNPEHLSHDPQVVKAYLDDPLVHHGKTPARLAVEIMKTMHRVTGALERITLPFLILLGGEERIVNPKGAKLLYEKAGSADKTLRIYEGLYHETFNEPERAQVLDDVRAWLEVHI